MPTRSLFRVFRSPIHGYGVIALKEFEPGEVLADVEGVLYAEEDLIDDRYCLWVDEGFYFDMVDQTRWINHSCAPNVEVKQSSTARAERGPASWRVAPSKSAKS